MSSSHSEHEHGHHGSPFIQHHFEGAKHQFDSGKLGIWLFLVTEVLFFSGLFVAYIIYRANHPEIFAYANHYLDTNMGAINTAVLIFSSLTAAWAVRCAQLNQQRGLIITLSITILCACVFLGVKYVEYKEKFEHGTLWGEKFNPHIAADGTHLGGHGDGDHAPEGHEDSGEGGEAHSETEGEVSGVADGETGGEASGETDREASGEADREASGEADSEASGEADSEASGEADSEAGGEADEDDEPGAGDERGADEEPGAHEDEEEAEAAQLDRGSAPAAATVVDVPAASGEDESMPAGAEPAGEGSPEHGAHGEGDSFLSGPPPPNTSMFFSIYFGMTGLHAIHVTAGIIVFIWLLIRASRRHFNAEYFGPVDYAALYWHLVDLIWIYLFPLLYLIH